MKLLKLLSLIIMLIALIGMMISVYKLSYYLINFDSLWFLYFLLTLLKMVTILMCIDYEKN